MSSPSFEEKLSALYRYVNTADKVVQLALESISLGISCVKLYLVLKRLWAEDEPVTRALPQNVQPEAFHLTEGKREVCFNRLEELLAADCQEAEYMVAAIELNHVDEETNELVATQSVVLVTVSAGDRVLAWNMPTSDYIPAYPGQVTSANEAMVRQHLEAAGYETTRWAVMATADVIESYTGKIARTGAMFPVSLEIFNFPGGTGSTGIIDLEKRTIKRRGAGEDLN